jgi:hypothetical protein
VKLPSELFTALISTHVKGIGVVNYFQMATIYENVSAICFDT